jgi:hypothetical protein
MENLTYEEFINNILETRGRFACGDKYHERHHIVPKCMSGSDDEENLIDLYAREHFIAHKLLALENPENDGLAYAWTMMAFVKDKNQERYELTPEEYEEARIKLSELASIRMKELWNDDEYRRRASESHKRENLSKETLEKLANASRGRKHTEEAKRKIGDVHKGKIVSEETRQKLSESHRKVWENQEYREEQIRKSKERCKDEAFRRQMSERRKSDWEDEEYRRKTTDGIRMAQKELWKNEKHREKMIAIRTDENGPYKSQEFRNKISKCTQGENNPMFGVHRYRENAPNKKKIIRLSDEHIYSCIIYAAEDNGVSTQTIRKRCKAHKDFMYYNEWLMQQNNCKEDENAV